MTSKSEPMREIGLSATDDAREKQQRADRDAALDQRIKTWNPERERRVTEGLDALLHWLQKP